MDNIRTLAIPNNSRVIVISDIHGELELLIKLLDKVNFDEADYLVINGDLCEKGSDSSGVVRYIMNLATTYPNVHVIEGNCDTLVEEVLNENKEVIDYLIRRKRSLINEWLNQVGCYVDSSTNVQAIKETLIKHYPDEIAWLMNLPTAIETEDYIFVHAGLDNVSNWRETERDTAFTLPSFLNKEHQAKQYVIVGHWPISNYSITIPDHLPIIDQQKKIISIDGGNILKTTGQLNAFIIERTEKGDSFTYTSVDHFPVREVKQPYTADSKMLGCINYPNYEIEPMKRDIHFTWCNHPSTNHTLYVKNEYMVEQDGHFCVKDDLSCVQIDVKLGDKVAIIDDTCSGYDLIKKDGQVGWVPTGVFEDRR
ncbi:metallophosphoesterase [Paraliobacillus ryukyuensis]|uniref:metallophosphoesterase n=1 Tax=Paraliobacillus ryukyuensis TaxID=200904 RepID=UPI0009A745BD|nr:metallophosphoesterase [Paraliobacillus ryukyuensis]